MAFVAELQEPIPQEVVEDFLSKLHYVSEGMGTFAMAEGKRDCVSFELAPGYEADSQAITARISEIARKMCAGHRPGQTKVLLSRVDRTVPFRDDPHEVLESAGEIFRFGKGRYGLGPRLVRLAEYFDTRLKELAKKFSADSYQFPSLIGADIMDRCRYLKAFPHALTLVAHLREDLEAIQDFSRTVEWVDGHLHCESKNLSGIECLLSPTVCFHYYAWLENSRLSGPTAITALGKCFRYESGNLGGLERLWDFTMRELILIGTAEFVLEQRQRAIDESVALFDEWGLAYEIKGATDPFFIEDYSAHTAFQSAFDLKFEARAALPYNGKTLAIASFNYHQDFFGRSLNISGDDGAACHTGCIGWGLERVVLAFLAQYGADSDLWPEPIRLAVDC